MKKILAVVFLGLALVSCDNGTTGSVDPVYVDLGPEHLIGGWEHDLGGNRILVFSPDMIFWISRREVLLLILILL